MTTTVLTLRIPEEASEMFDKFGQATLRAKSFLAEDAVARYIDLEAWQVGEIEQAIQEADRDDFANPSDMADLLKKYAG